MRADLLPQLADCAGIALSGTPYRQAEMDASPAMQVVARIGVGYDAVEVPALTARGVPLMTAGIANSTSVAEQAFSPDDCAGEEEGVTTRFVQKCTLSRAGQERGGNIA
jgi:D-3-phosphoglycerate dehydrogenase